MFHFPIGVRMKCLRMEMRESVETAASLGLQGLQIPATYGEYTPQNMTGSKRAAFLRLIKDNGLTVSAVCGDLGHGFGNAADNPALIEQSFRIMELAKEMGANIVATHIGVVPADPNHDCYKVMQEACRRLAEYADQLGGHFAVETGPETAAVLKGFLDSLHSKGVAVNLDPANLVMVTGDDPVQAVYTLKDYIVHTHAKDGVRYYPRDPEAVYGVIQAPKPDRPAFQETPLGEGKVPFGPYLKALEEIGYRGFLTIEREAGEDRAGDIGKAADYLRGFYAYGLSENSKFL